MPSISQQDGPGLPVVPTYLVTMGRSLQHGAWLPVPSFCEVGSGPTPHPAGSRAQVLAVLERRMADMHRVAVRG